jgi:hypothetical protein
MCAAWPGAPHNALVVPRFAARLDLPACLPACLITMLRPLLTISLVPLLLLQGAACCRR